MSPFLIEALLLASVALSSFGDIEAGVTFAESDGQLILIDPEIGSSSLTSSDLDRLAVDTVQPDWEKSDKDSPAKYVQSVVSDVSNWLWLLSVLCCVASVSLMGKMNYAYSAILLTVAIFSFGSSVWIHCNRQKT